MKLADKLFDFIKSLDEKEFKKYTYIAITIIIVIAGFITYRHFTKVASLQNELKKLNISRQEAQVILSKELEIKKQNEIVDEILKKDRSFKIRQYFDSVVSKMGLEKSIKTDPETSTSELETLRTQGYMEVKIEAKFTEINTKQLAELLDEFEKNERIYTKSLEITKSNRTPTIDVDIVIATLQPKTEITESVG
jgi:hypothetical protein